MSEKNSRQIRTSIVTVILVSSGILLLLLPFFAFRWAQTPFLGFFLDPNLVVNDSGNPQWASKQLMPPISYPERLVTIDDIDITNESELQQLLQSRQVGDEIEIRLVQPINSLVASKQPIQERTVLIKLTSFSVGDLWNQFGLFYLTGVFIWGIGVWVFRIRPHEEEAQLFALLSAAGAITIGAIFDLNSTHAFMPIWVLSLSMLGVLGIWLASVFPHETRLVARWPWLKRVMLLLGVLTAVWGTVWLSHPTDPWAYAISWRFAFLLNGVGFATILIMMAYRGYGSQSVTVRQQGRIILLGGLLAFTPLLVFLLAAAFAVHLPWLPPSLYIPPIIIFPFSFGYSIVRYRLIIDTSHILLRRSVTYAIVTGLLAGMMVLLVTGITATFGTMAESPWLIAILLVSAVLLFDPIRDRLQQGIALALFRQPIAFDELLGAYRRELTTAVHMDQVADVMLEYIDLGVPKAQTYLYLPDHKTSSFTSYANHTELIVNANSPLVEFMSRQTGAIDLAEERAWPDTFRRHHRAVAALNATLLVPMSNGDELLGWLALTPKKEVLRFQPNELSYLSSLAENSLLGLERANVVRRLENRISELDLLTQFSQFLSYTDELDDLLELVSTSFERLLDIDDFFVVLINEKTDQVYKAFHLEAGDRLIEKEEGVDHLVTQPNILQVVSSGQSEEWVDANGRFWFAAPLNAGRNTLGAIYANYQNAERTLRPRQQRLFTVFADRAAVALERLRANSALTERAQQLEIINQVTFSLATIIELEPLLELILDNAMELLHTEAGTFMLTDDATGELVFRVARGPASDKLVGTRLPVGAGLAGTVIQTGQPVLVNDVQDDKRWFARLDTDSKTHFRSNSILTVPLIRQNNVLGVLQMINKKNGSSFQKGDQQLLMTFAGQAVVAIENARLLSHTDEALRKSVDELSLLQQLDRDLNTTLDLDHVLNLTLERMLGICKGTAGAIVLVDEEKRPFSVTTRDYEDSFTEQPLLEEIPSGLIGKVIRTGKPHMTGNVHEEKEYIAANFNTHSQMTLPFLSKQELIGVIAIERDEMDAFDPVDVETAVRVANHAAVAIANAILYEKVNEANHAKSEFVSMVSHELKTPMTSIRGYVDLLLSGMTGDLSEQQHSFLETISANIRRMGQQIQDLTDISRIETQLLHIEIAPTSLSKVMGDTLQTVQSLCDDKNIRLHIDDTTQLPQVLADESRLIQVMTNLLSNGCKYSPEGSDITVTFQSATQDNISVVQCSVQDTGYGISEEDVAQLFTKFFRSNDPNIRQSKGTGLGLSIVKGIIEMQGGKIWVESSLGKGTTFHFTIPQS